MSVIIISTKHHTGNSKFKIQNNINVAKDVRSE